jgi:hypothetical protein
MYPQRVRIWPGHEGNSGARLIAAFGLVGLTVLVAGAVAFAHFEPVQPASGIHAPVHVERYDPATRHVTGPPRTRYAPDEIPAGMVAWGSVPGGLTVQAAWFDEEGYRIAATRAAPPGAQPPVLPLSTERQVAVPPGTYLFIAGRYEGGRITEVLGRTSVQVATT